MTYINVSFMMQSCRLYMIGYLSMNTAGTFNMSSHIHVCALTHLFRYSIYVPVFRHILHKCKYVHMASKEMNETIHIHH